MNDMNQAREQLIRAIRALTVDFPDDRPNGAAEAALMRLCEEGRRIPDQALHRGFEEWLAANADLVARLREAAEGYFGQDFRTPMPHELEVGSAGATERGAGVSVRPRRELRCWIDLETTGLDPQIDNILELGLTIADTEGRPTARQRVGPPGASTGPLVSATWCAQVWLPSDDAEVRVILGSTYEMHMASGLVAACQQSKFRTVHQLEAEALAYLDQVGIAPKTSPMCGSSVHFDRSFLRVDMPSLHDWFHYRNFDASTVVAFTQDILPGFTFPEREKKHRALEDIERSIQLVRDCRAALEAMSGKQTEQ